MKTRCPKCRLKYEGTPGAIFRWALTHEHAPRRRPGDRIPWRLRLRIRSLRRYLRREGFVDVDVSITRVHVDRPADFATGDRLQIGWDPADRTCAATVVVDKDPAGVVRVLNARAKATWDPPAAGDQAKGDATYCPHGVAWLEPFGCPACERERA